MGKDRIEVEEGKEVVRRTSVGGRPRVRKKAVLKVPIGIEKVVYRAAADPEFRERLFADRQGAVTHMGFNLLDSELAILLSVPNRSLAAMIDRIDPERHGRRRFMRKVAACALAVATSTVLLDASCSAPAGCLPEPDTGSHVAETHAETTTDVVTPPGGIMPDEVVVDTAEVEPREPADEGIGPDLPE